MDPVYLHLVIVYPLTQYQNISITKMSHEIV